MIEINVSKLIGEGSNSKVYSCNIDGKECAVKVPHNAERFMSCALQSDSLMACQKTNLSFVVPRVIQYKNNHETWGEMLIMDKLDKLYPIGFLMRNGLMDWGHIIGCAAKAIAELHNLGISGFDVEFYWSYEYKKMALLDLGPRYTIGYTGTEMVGKHYKYAIENQNWMIMWNLVSELFDRSESMPLFSKIVRGKEIPRLEELHKAVGECAEQEHICGVARNHFLQLMGDCPEQLRKEMLHLFIRKYSAYAKVANYLYISAFKKAHRENITSNSAYLYISKYNTLSKMSNFVSIS